MTTKNFQEFHNIQDRTFFTEDVNGNGLEMVETYHDGDTHVVDYGDMDQAQEQAWAVLNSSYEVGGNMTKVKDLQVRFPNTFKAIAEMLSDNGCKVCPLYDVPDTYITMMEQAEDTFAELISKKFGDVVSLKEVEALVHKHDADLDYLIMDYKDRKDDTAVMEFVAGEYEFQMLIEERYGAVGGVATSIINQVFDGELSDMSTLCRAECPSEVQVTSMAV